MKKKKIIFIVNNFWIGGVEKLLSGLVCELSSIYEIVIVTVLGSGPLEAEFRNIPVRIYHASPVIFADKKLPLKLFWLAAAPVTLLRVVIFLVKVKPDVVVTSLYQADILGTTGAFLAGIKKRILIQHDVQSFGFFRKYFKYFLAINLATDIISVSDTVSKFLVSYWHISKDRIITIYNGINVERFSEAAKPLNGKNPVFGIIGRLEPVKGHIYALEALKILKDKYKLEPKVIIAGGGSLEVDLKEYAKKNLLKKVEFVGPIADAQPFLKLIDVTVVPSLEEGFGLVVLEGLVAKKVVLASDIEVFKELIQPGQNGILFKVRNAEELSREIKNLVEHPDLIEKYTRSTELWMNEVGHKYDIRNVLSQYQEIIGGPK